MKLNKIILFLLGLSMAVWQCSDPYNIVEYSTDANFDFYWDYDQQSDELFMQVEVEDDFEVYFIDHIRVELRDLDGGTYVDINYSLLDNGENGDVIPGNYIFSRKDTIVLPYGRYVFKIIIDSEKINEPNRTELFYYIKIEEEFIPEIISVEMNESFELDPTETTMLDLSVTVKELNRVEDIKFVRYFINTDAMFKDDYSTPECDRQWGLTDNGFVTDPTWFMGYQNKVNDSTFVFSTSIPMRSVDDCGGTGVAQFRFSVTDNAGLSSNNFDTILEIFGCGDGDCTSGFEDIDTCSEDCE